MNGFFDENGIINIDESVMKMESFQKIMEDGIVTDSEMAEQAQCVTSLLHKVEDECNATQLGLIKELLSEMSVLYIAYHYKELQSLK